MSFLTHLFRPQLELAPDLAARVQAWRALERASERTPFAQARFVVLDVETTGLDPRRDRLLSIGAVVVEAARLRAGEGYAVTVHNPAPSARANILVHGITPDDQTGGLAADEAVMGFLELARHDVLVGFHAGFDRLVLERAAREVLGVRLPNLWLDLAVLAPQLVPAPGRASRNLDDWLDQFELRVHTRHQAAADAFATAELLLIMLAQASRAGLRSVSQLLAAGEARERFRT